MRRTSALLFFFVFVTFSAWARPRPTGDPNIIPQDAKLETLFTGGVLTEGVASAPEGTIYFSDITFTYTSGMQAGHLMKYDPRTGETVVFRSPSGMSNGIKFDSLGRMIVAEGADFGGRRVTRTDLRTGKSEILAGLYEGRPLNSPNDITIDEQGRIYFSDPRYLGHEPIDQPLMAVYRIDADRSLHRIVTDAGKPNGVALSPDQKTLYVGSNDNGTTGLFRIPQSTPIQRGRMALNAYDLHPDGTAKFRKVLVDYYPDEGPDGLVTDVDGNLYVAVRVASRPGIYIYSPDGKELAFIPTPELPTNAGFGRGNEGTTLYITAGGSLHRIKLKKAGYHLPSR
ncbi:MAG: SMP-30/gluconolactonase/LRE family protein [Acidobacteria bacterium]|nr:SMP-30/gluconolactonase/LRE family protein [Acidobacteriota bacterium]MCI0721524.1 SMP-30/gluconolactonase/LRE family protein [Acidobacteriota bacterium]